MIIEKFRKIKSESGQAMLEYAVTILMFLSVVFAIMDFAWYSYQNIVFNYSYQLASWQLSVNDPNIDHSYYYTGSTTGKLIYDEITKNAIGINKSKLSVYNPRIDLYTEYFKYRNPGDRSDSTEKRRYMKITARIEYEFYPFTFMGRMFFGRRILLVKNLSRLRLLQSKR